MFHFSHFSRFFFHLNNIYGCLVRQTPKTTASAQVFREAMAINKISEEFLVFCVASEMITRIVMTHDGVSLRTQAH